MLTGTFVGRVAVEHHEDALHGGMIMGLTLLESGHELFLKHQFVVANFWLGSEWLELGGEEQARASEPAK